MQRYLNSLFCLCLPLITCPLSRAADLDTLVLVHGTTLVGEILAESATEVTFRDAILGVLKFPPEAIQSRPTAQATAAPGGDVALADVGPGPAPTAPVQAAPGNTAPHWTRTVQLGWGQVTAAAPTLGQGAHRSINLTLGLERTTERHIHSFIASYNSARAKPAPPYANTLQADFQYDHILSPKNRLVSQTSFLRDPPKTIRHRTEQMFGFARLLVDTPSATLLVAPGLSFASGAKEYEGDVDNQHFKYGVYQIFNYTLSPTLSLQQKLKGTRSFEDPQYIRASAAVTMSIRVNQSMAFETSLNGTYDGRPARGVEKLQIQTNTGMRFQF